jgi:threonine synthase
MAFEIFEQLDGKIPGAVLVPAGQGGLLLGLWRGFCALRIAINIKDIRPKIIGVQSKACAPLWIEYSGTEEDIPVRSTIAEGVQVRYPIRKDAVIQAVKASRGCISAVEEEDIIPGRNSLRKLGFYVEPTSAIVWAVLEKIIHQLPDPVVVILTGSGLKQETNHIRIN